MTRRPAEDVRAQLAQLGIDLIITDQVDADVVVVTSVDPLDPNPGPPDGRTVVLRLADDADGDRCDCDCHRPGSRTRHMAPCCRPRPA